MKCPKCESKIGLHYHERILVDRSNAQGICCFMCGFWMNGPEQDALVLLKKFRSLRRR